MVLMFIKGNFVLGFEDNVVGWLVIRFCCMRLVIVLFNVWCVFWVIVSVCLCRFCGRLMVVCIVLF